MYKSPSTTSQSAQLQHTDAYASSSEVNHYSGARLSDVLYLVGCEEGPRDSARCEPSYLHRQLLFS